MKLPLLSLVLAFAIATPVLADPRHDAQTPVHSRDLDLSTSKGVRTLYKRIRLVAQDVCQSDVNDPATQVEDQQCARQAVTDAVRQFGIPMLSRLDDNAQPSDNHLALADREQ